MLLLKLEVEDFGVFRGHQAFDLAPAGRGRRLTVFVGHNGAGKSTLYQAIGLALQGRGSLGGRVTQEEYQAFLASRFHRAGDQAPSRHASSVALRFEYVRSGKPLEIEVKRHWRAAGRAVAETLSIKENGAAVDVPDDDLELWLGEMVPPALTALCLFDAEQMEMISDPERYSALIRRAIDRVLGLDLVVRLREDLNYLTVRQGGTRVAERLREQVLRAQANVDEAEANILAHAGDQAALDACEAELRGQLEAAERELALAGGTYAARRPILQEQLGLVATKIQAAEESIRVMSADLLPFALVPELCQKFRTRLGSEAEARRIRVAEDLWEERLRSAEEVLRADGTWDALSVSTADRASLTEALLGQLRGTANAEQAVPAIHHLSDADHEKVRDWIRRVLHDVPSQAISDGERLRHLRGERRDVQRELERAPDVEALADIHARIAVLRGKIDAHQVRRRAMDVRAGTLRAQRAEHERVRERAATELARAQADERQMRLAETSKLVLRTYEDALLQRYLRGLEAALVHSFNMLCQKDQLLATVSIDAADCSVEMSTMAGESLKLRDLSAGERQLFALAVMKALRDASGRQLPIVVDTPTARLDGEHRTRFLRDYIPAAGNQALLFATDAEIDDAALQMVEPELARVYRLAFDPENMRTLIRTEGTRRHDAVALSA